MLRYLTSVVHVFSDFVSRSGVCGRLDGDSLEFVIRENKLMINVTIKSPNSAIVKTLAPNVNPSCPPMSAVTKALMIMSSSITYS